MIDRTQEDINQDARLAKLEQHFREHDEAIADLKVAKDHTSVTLRLQNVKLAHLDPLSALVEYVEHIVEFFERWSKGLTR